MDILYLWRLLLLVTICHRLHGYRALAYVERYSRRLQRIHRSLGLVYPTSLVTRRYSPTISSLTISNTLPVSKLKLTKTEIAPVTEARPKVDVDIYGEAFCPDTIRLFRGQLDSIMMGESSLSDIINLRYIAFGKGYCVPSGTSDYSCQCQHGAKECFMNTLMDCVMEKVTNQTHWFPVVSCLHGKSLNTAGSCFTSHGLRVAPFETCATTSRGRQLLADAARLTNDLSPRLRRVPWVIIDGHRSLSNEFKLRHSICKAYGNHKPC